MSVISLKLPRPPSVNAMYATDFKTKRRFKSKAYEQWKYEAGLELNSQHQERIVGDVDLCINLGRGRKKNGEVSKRRIDASNFIKPIEDLLVSHSLIVDDSYVKCVRCCWDESVGPGTALVSVWSSEIMETAEVSK